VRKDCLYTPQLTLDTTKQHFMLPIVLETGEVLVYPNPSLGIFTVRADAYPPEADVVIFDANAREVTRRKLADGYFDLSAQPTGMYLLQLTHIGIRPRTLKLEIVKD
jgi:Secretion system C-terminal sorting domain